MKRALVICWFFAAACTPSDEDVAHSGIDMGADLGHGSDLGSDVAASVLTRISIEPVELFVEKGTTATLTATAFDADGVLLRAPFTWSSTDDSVAEVTESGVVIGHELGSAEVTATSAGIDGHATVYVTGPPVARIEVSPTTREMRPGDTVAMTVTAYDALNAPVDDPRATTFTSSDDAVVIVDDSGLVTAVSEGTAQVTTRVETVDAQSTFTVTGDAIDRLDVSPVSLDLVRGETRQLIASAYSGGTMVTAPTFVWSSSNDAVATVDSQGIVTGVAVGDATVLAAAVGLSATSQVAVTFDFTSIDAGGEFACGLVGGVAYCWGRNTDGQLGRPGTPGAPGAVATALRFDQLALGTRHACAIATTGATYCWGAGTATPTVVGGGHSFTSIFAGYASTCGTEAGELWCWGEVAATPTDTGTWDSTAIGASHRCAIGGTAASCWGSNASGQLGVNAAGGSYPNPTSVTGGFDFARLVAGRAHTCGSTPAGATLCWGDNTFGQLGDGTMTQRVTPILLGGGVSLARLAAGPNHTCGLTSAGAAYCWGNNSNGQLGIGQTGSRADPTAVSTSERFIQIAAGESFTCALSVDGVPYCWGDGTSGQLGTADSTNVPVAVGGL